MNHLLFIYWSPTSSPNLIATVPGVKWVFSSGTQNKCPTWEVPLHSGETAEPLRPAHHLGALTSRPQAERSLDRGPFLGEFHSSDHGSSSAKGLFISWWPLSQDLSPVGPGLSPRGAAAAFSHCVPALNMNNLGVFLSPLGPNQILSTWCFPEVCCGSEQPGPGGGQVNSHPGLTAQ